MQHSRSRKKRSSKLSNLAASTFFCALMVVCLWGLLSPNTTPVRAQSTSAGTVSGQVTDPQGDAVAGAAVSLRDTATNAELKTVTNDAGRYAFVNVPPGL